MTTKPEYPCRRSRRKSRSRRQRVSQLHLYVCLVHWSILNITILSYLINAESVCKGLNTRWEELSHWSQVMMMVMEQSLYTNFLCVQWVSLIDFCCLICWHNYDRCICDRAQWFLVSSWPRSRWAAEKCKHHAAEDQGGPDVMCDPPANAPNCKWALNRDWKKVIHFKSSHALTPDLFCFRSRARAGARVWYLWSWKWFLNVFQ